MKKIVNFIILFVVCLLPTLVADAKVNYEYDWTINGRLFWNKENGEYKTFYYYDWDFFNNTIYSYDKNGSYLNSYPFDEEIGDNYEEFLNSEKFEIYQMLIAYYYGEVYYKETDSFNYVNYYDGYYYFYDPEQGSSSKINFEDDVALTKKYLGKKYDIYLKHKDDNEVDFVTEINGYYVAYLNDWSLIYVYDEELNALLNCEFSNNFYSSIYVYDDLIYIAMDNETIDIYKIDGTKHDTIKINHEDISADDYDSCSGYDFNYFYIVDDELYIVYDHNECDARIVMRDENDVKDFVGEIAESDSLLLKYTLDYDIETVSSSNGEFTYETKEDEDGKSYVELKITPKDGYSVEDIIVTDIYGNRIEVTNNKFYKPLNDVKIEVKYVNGEYLPIPNTALSQSVTLIIIGVILVGLGFYTINYVRSEEK